MNDEERIIKILESLNGKVGFSVAEIAELLGLFPSDVEEAFKDLFRKGLIKCSMYHGQLYAYLEEEKHCGITWRDELTVIYQ